jgi:hypothetical protein
MKSSKQSGTVMHARIIPGGSSWWDPVVRVTVEGSLKISEFTSLEDFLKEWKKRVPSIFISSSNSMQRGF